MFSGYVIALRPQLTLCPMSIHLPSLIHPLTQVGHWHGSARNGEEQRSLYDADRVPTILDAPLHAQPAPASQEIRDPTCISDSLQASLP